MIAHLHIRAINPFSVKGFLDLRGLRFPCLLGHKGRSFIKCEGDGKSPKGKWRLLNLYYRPDRLGRFNCALAMTAMKASDGWCDDKSHGRYNQKVHLPFQGSHELMWRSDEAYDLVVTTSHNQRPRVKGAGSAIFLHLWREGAQGTQGCIALRPKDLRRLLTLLPAKSYLVI